MITPDNTGKKFDSGKDPWHLLPMDALRGVTKILASGAVKYGERNWERGMDWSRLQRAAVEHLTVWFHGVWDDDGNWSAQPKDPETGKSHLWHAACCVLFLAALEIRRVGKDDRPVYGPAAAPEAPLAGIPGWEAQLDVPKPLEPLTWPGVPHGLPLKVRTAAEARENYAYADNLGRPQRPLEPEEIDPIEAKPVVVSTFPDGYHAAKTAFTSAGSGKAGEEALHQMLSRGQISVNAARRVVQEDIDANAAAAVAKREAARAGQPDRPWCNGMTDPALA